jgi:site-specific DNA-cytosine methylase
MMRTGSLFSSGGGWEVGAARLGYQPAWGVEHDPMRAALWNQTFPKANPGCMTGDVRDPRIVLRTTPVDVLFTSPVCRDFSVSRSRVDEATVDACRPMLGLATLEYVDRLLPPVVMLENVPAYARAAPYLKLVDGMQSRGYSVTEAALNGADFGNPSSRPRLFSVFVLRGSGASFRWPQPTGRVSWDAALASHLFALPRAPSTGALERNLAAWARTNRAVTYPLLFVSQKQGVRDGTPDYFVRAGRPAPTLIVGHSAITGWRVLLGPDDIRRLDGTAAAMLNGFLVPGRFPKTYGAGVKEKVVADTAGDAVSPIMAEALLSGVSLP